MTARADRQWAQRQRAERLVVRKTYKLFVDGAFPRSESGRAYPVLAADGVFLANAAAASGEDLREAARAARQAFPAWSAATAYLRGQVLYRVAELLEGRRDQLAAEVSAAEGVDAEAAGALVDAAVDRWVWYAGWCDKVAQVAGAVHPVAGPFLSLSAPRPVGVVGLLAPQGSSLLGLVSTLAPIIVSGNTCVLIAAGRRPFPAVTLAEALAVSDLPRGAVNVLTGDLAELAPCLAAHEDLDALDLAGAADLDWGELEAAAATTLTRVLRPAGHGPAGAPGGAVEPDWRPMPDGPWRILAFTETKTTWHPKGR
jgi:acyl-CoA reductase-like NAD-dependent aldehyde dehydrogenase